MPLKVLVNATTLPAHTQRIITGRTFPSWPALLRGFRRGLVAGKPFPSLGRETGGEVYGELLEQVHSPEFDLLDRHEGERWERLRVEVQLGPGHSQPAWVWLLGRPEAAG
jgi:hypothetical protein